LPDLAACQWIIDYDTLFGFPFLIQAFPFLAAFAIEKDFGGDFLCPSWKGG
jgi:hypothetical protein